MVETVIERGVAEVTHWVHIRKIPSSNPGADEADWGSLRGFPQTPTQMLSWIFITTMHLTIIHQIYES